MRNDMVCPGCHKKGFCSRSVSTPAGSLKCCRCGKWTLAEDWTIPHVWQKVSKQLPKAGKKVICYFKNHYDKHRRIMAFYAPKFTIEEENDDSDVSEYCEEKDNYFLLEGWYEMNEFDETHWMVSNEITHWMDLPSVPVAE